MLERRVELTRFAVAQLGARMHYAVPEIFQRSGMLARLYTDIYCPKFMSGILEKTPLFLKVNGLRRFGGRFAKGLPDALVKSYPAFGLEYLRRLALAGDRESKLAAFLWSGKKFCELVGENLDADVNSIYAFNGAALELFISAKNRGCTLYLEQTIAPLQVEDGLLSEEVERYPGWEEIPAGGEALARSLLREREEWRLADTIICGSAFVKDSIGAVGGPLEKCVVVPYGLSIAGEFAVRKHPGSARKLRVLTVGRIGLRKGIPYVVEAASRLRDIAEFRIAGPLQLLPAAKKTVEDEISVSGLVPRSEMAAYYQWADILLQPSICEGSATVSYEGMMHGLPVICTPNTGSVVRDGKEGFIVGLRDVDAIVDSIRKLNQSGGLLEEMSRNARERIQHFSLDEYARRLLGVVRGV